ncbi:hypothetical protein FIA58_011350 [Flavobacterium jejuense]|uniref:SMODS-associating 2TM beta-strand rich effector domain-containing protein n=1 Tax=Flavobacterium jejuense TaxID=1544455 RepID=A0ABX0IWU2_9FLAO|nr:hypothetical protein [Flavobacterium jejuense]NHN26274.1 hypothetical protein [Flavobacterium jejuense]
MIEFKCNIFDSIFSKGLRNFMLVWVLYLSSSFINYSEFIPSQIGVFEIVIIYLLLFVIQILLTNTDLILDEEEIVIQSSLFKGLRKRKFKIEHISEIIFKEEWTESSNKRSRFKTVLRFILNNFILMWFIPWEYKWIQIKTKNNEKFRYYFFGTNYDCYDNDKEILFEDLFLELNN